ncbi:MAG: UDP-N-acetylmuramate dehydrogenase [Chloroflexota bacterium]
MAGVSPAVLERLRAAVGPRNVLPGEPVARYTTWKVGGPADALCLAGTIDGLCRAVGIAREEGLPWRVLGRGSNVLVADAGVEGVLILNRCARIAIDATMVRSESGAMLSALGKRTIAAGLRGLEWAAGIPGTVGGLVAMNAGAHGGDMAAVLVGVTTLGPGGERRAYSPGDLRLGYRSSLFRAGTPRDEVILTASFALAPDDVGVLEQTLAGQRAQRKATQPQGQASAGSVFKNPPDGSAARMIDSLGLKGTIVGGAQVSPVHANFMVNLGTATAEDIVALIQLVRRRVYDTYGVDLHPEVQQIGRWRPQALIVSEGA